MNSEPRSFWKDGLGSFLIAVLIALTIRWAFVEAYVIPSGSMLPTLLVHDHIFVNKISFGLRVPFSEQWIIEFSSPARGEVIVFRYPQEPSLFFIKRVVGLPGDRIFYENGHLYVNEQLIDRQLPQGVLVDDMEWLRDKDFPGEGHLGGLSNYAHWQERLDQVTYSILLRQGSSPGPAFGPYHVPQGHYFVMGDNRDNSRDSRLWGVQSTRAKGVVQMTYTGKGQLNIPQGSIVKTRGQGKPEERFSTLESTVISNQGPVQVEVEAVYPGPLGNIVADQLEGFDGVLAQNSDLKVSNKTAFSGGEDDRYVPRKNLIGKAMFVWLSCEETLSFATFLCNPLKLRWNRFFHSVQ